MRSNFAAHRPLRRLFGRVIGGVNRQVAGDDLPRKLLRLHQLPIVQRAAQLDVRAGLFDTGDDGRNAESLLDDGGKDVLAQVVAHVLEPLPAVDVQRNFTPDRGGDNVQDLPVFFVHVADRQAVEGAVFTRLAAAARKKDGLVQNNGKAAVAGRAGKHLRLCVKKRGVIVKKSSGHRRLL